MEVQLAVEVRDAPRPDHGRAVDLLERCDDGLIAINFPAPVEKVDVPGLKRSELRQIAERNTVEGLDRDRCEVLARGRRNRIRHRAVVFLDLHTDPANHGLHRAIAALDKQIDEEPQLAFDNHFEVVLNFGGNFIVDMQRVQNTRLAVDDLQAQAVVFVELSLADLVLAKMADDRLFNHVHHMLEADPGADVVAFDPRMDRRGGRFDRGDGGHW